MAREYNGCVHLGVLLRQRRKEQRLRQLDVAARIGVDQSRISRWEDGECPDRPMWPRIATFLGVTANEVAQLIAGDDDRDSRHASDRLDVLESKVELLSRYVAQLVDGLREAGLTDIRVDGHAGPRGPDQPAS